MNIRYDYRRDYANMSITEMRDALSKLIDRFLGSFDDSTQRDCIKRMSYIEAKIKKHDEKRATKLAKQAEQA